MGRKGDREIEHRREGRKAQVIQSFEANSQCTSDTFNRNRQTLRNISPKG